MAIEIKMGGGHAKVCGTERVPSAELPPPAEVIVEGRGIDDRWHEIGRIPKRKARK